MRYTVNTGHGMTDGAVLRGSHRTRGDAKRQAVELILAGETHAEVRRDYALLDSYVLRGKSPRHIYGVRQREGQCPDDES